MSAYKQGFIDGMTAFAHWKDGVQLVGTMGTTLAKAKAEVEKSYNFSPPPSEIILEDMTIPDLIELIEEVRDTAKAKQLSLEGGCACHISPPCSFCVAGGNAEIP